MERFNKGSSAPKKSGVSIFSMCNLKISYVFIILENLFSYLKLEGFKFSFSDVHFYACKEWPNIFTGFNLVDS